MANATSSDTAERILDVAEELVQTRGLNAMSYADISERIGIRKASLHYHFPTKATLVRALIARYAEHFFAALAQLDTTTNDPAELLRGYADIYRGVLERGRMCLCGMLASDYETLSPDAQDDVGAFFERNADWLERVIEAGTQDGRLTVSSSSRAAAEAFMAGLEGAMLVSRPFPDTDRFTQISGSLLGAFKPATTRG